MQRLQVVHNDSSLLPRLQLPFLGKSAVILLHFPYGFSNRCLKGLVALLPALDHRHPMCSVSTCSGVVALAGSTCSLIRQSSS